MYVGDIKKEISSNVEIGKPTHNQVSTIVRYSIYAAAGI